MADKARIHHLAMALDEARRVEKELDATNRHEDALRTDRLVERVSAREDVAASTSGDGPTEADGR